MKLRLQRRDLRESLLKASMLSMISSGFTYLFLRQWVVMTISLGPVDKIYQAVDAAAQLAFFIVLICSFISSYIKINVEI